MLAMCTTNYDNADIKKKTMQKKELQLRGEAHMSGTQRGCSIHNLRPHAMLSFHTSQHTVVAQKPATTHWFLKN